MLEHIPHWLGSLLKNLRAGHAKLTIVRHGRDRKTAIALSSPAFADGARLPERFTDDGEGLSPPLIWGEVPEATVSLALIVEDPDAPAPSPIVHALVWNIPPGERTLPEGAIVRDGSGSADGRDVGRNSYFGEGWLPPDPPNGHGVHDYVFQLFALSQTVDISGTPSRADFDKAIQGGVLAAGLLVGTYSRGEPAASGGLSEALAAPSR